MHACVNQCIERAIIVDFTSSAVWIFLACVAEEFSWPVKYPVVNQIGSFAVKFYKLWFELENKSNHRPVSNSPKFRGNAEIPLKHANSAAWLKTWSCTHLCSSVSSTVDLSLDANSSNLG